MSSLEPQDPRDPLFKGCTRPAMLFGVPVVPMVFAGGTVFLFSVYTTLLCMPLLIPLVITMRLITKSDDQMFRLLRLKLRFRFRNPNKNFWKASAYSPLEYTKRK
ncbi:MAG: type IV secretion protein B [Pseudomonas sp.]|jgi:type IV secretion system protein VirB3|nr:MAG: type IV secretion protein B [Pseudomonas sp.]